MPGAVLLAAACGGASEPIVVTWGTAGEESVKSVAVDADGNSYVLGSTTGAFAGAVNQGKRDLFLSRVDRTGEVAWTRQWGSAEDDKPIAVFVDGESLLVVTSTATGTPSCPSADVWMDRLATDGQEIERVQAQLTGLVDPGHAYLSPVGVTLSGTGQQVDAEGCTSLVWMALVDGTGGVIENWTGNPNGDDYFIELGGREVSNATGAPYVIVYRRNDYVPEGWTEYLMRFSDWSLPSASPVWSAYGGVYELDGAAYTVTMIDYDYPSERATIVRLDAWESPLNLPSFVRMGHGDVPAVFGEVALDGDFMADSSEHFQHVALRFDPDDGSLGEPRVLLDDSDPRFDRVYLHDMAVTTGGWAHVGGVFSPAETGTDAMLVIVQL